MQKRPGRLPIFSSHIFQPRSNTLLPYRLPGIPPFLHQSLSAALRLLLPLLFNPGSVPFISFSQRSLGVLSHHYCLCLPSLSLLGTCLCSIHLPNTFYELNPFSHGVLQGLGADIDSHLASSSSFALSLAHLQLRSLFISSVNAFTWVSRLSSLIPDEIVFGISNLREHREPFLFIFLYTRRVLLMHLIYAYISDVYGAPNRKQQFSSWSKMRPRWLAANVCQQCFVDLNFPPHFQQQGKLKTANI